MGGDIKMESGFLGIKIKFASIFHSISQHLHMWKRATDLQELIRSFMGSHGSGFRMRGAIAK
jgi:hypothetical protein